MKKLFVILAATLAASSCLSVRVDGRHGIRPIEAGEMTEQVREIPTDYTALSTGTSADIIVSPDVKPGTVVVRAGKNVIDRLGTEVREGRLSVGWKGSISIWNGGGTQVLVPMSAYTHLSTSSSGDIILPTGFRASELNIRTSSSGDVKGEAVVERDVNISISSSGDVTLAGSCGGSFTARTSSSGDVNCGRFICPDARVSTSSSGNVHIAATRSIEASSSSSGDIYYSGSAQLTRSRTSSSGKIRRF